MARILCITLACSALLLAACSDDENADDDGGTGGTGGSANCGTLADPVLFTLRDVTPASGSGVPNDAVVHGFTIANAPASITQLTLVFGAGHTAGFSDPMALTFTIMPMGADLRYEASPLVWQNAPAEVDLSVAERFTTPDQCVYAFPEPLFRYGLTEAAGGAGGGGGAGGTGGSGGG